MSPLVFALIFVVIECLTLFFIGCFGYARLRTRLEDVEPHLAGEKAMRELSTRLIEAHRYVLDQRSKVLDDPFALERANKAVAALRDLAGRIAAGEWISPAHSNQLIDLCCEMASVKPEPAAKPEPPAESVIEFKPEITSNPAETIV